MRLAVSVKTEGAQSSMSIESIEHCESRQGMTRAQRMARACWSWISIASLCVACGGHAAPEDSPDVGASSSAGASSASGTNWCEIQAILQSKCQRCHQLPPQHGAPFSLLTYDDTQAQDSTGKARFEQMASAVDSEYMPPQFLKLDPPVALLTADERATLLAWCSQGALLIGSATCSADP